MICLLSFSDILLVLFLLLFTLFSFQCLCLVAQLCPTLRPHDCSLPGSSVHGILQARILEWVAISFSRGSSWARDRTRVSCIAGRFFTNWAIRKSYWRLKGFPGAQRIKNPPAMRVRAVSWKDPLEEGMATHSSILAWRILWTEEPGGYSH